MIGWVRKVLGISALPKGAPPTGESTEDGRNGALASAQRLITSTADELEVAQQRADVASIRHVRALRAADRLLEDYRRQDALLRRPPR